MSADPAYKKWLYDNKHPLYARSIINHSSRVSNLIFSDEFVLLTNNSKKQNDMRVMGNLCRYHDIKYDTNLHEQFTAWLKKKEIKWNVTTNRNNYHIASQILLSDVLSSIDNLPLKYKIFGLFVLTTGLRTEESIMAFNNHSKICCDGVMELFWDRKTKKSNAVFCHPKIHNKITTTINKSGIKRHMNSSILGCELRYLRKLNYTINATKIDSSLAEFMQGRRGNVSQRHYFLPIMSQHKKKWIKIWKNILLTYQYQN
uniref:Integrase SSV1 C-terminal domain-containing protein n=1 Tax=uncultured marine crenarchaeote HF4000_APKG6D9 TaxID=455597 RepID=B3T952_9ARCH|nr:hypothetical protein ALOHA_HF4000APKG6D9ctg2g16 [uncultured marine crenarchaeote HF4000_APKG6D9]